MLFNSIGPWRFIHTSTSIELRDLSRNEKTSAACSSFSPSGSDLRPAQERLRSNIELF